MDFGGGGAGFREVIQPGAITEAMLRAVILKMLLEHNKQRLLAEVSSEKGTLGYQITGKGVAYQLDSPKHHRWKLCRRDVDAWRYDRQQLRLQCSQRW